MLVRARTVAGFIVLIALILFLAAGRLDWGWAWAYQGICLVSVLTNAVIMLRVSPETIAERGQPQDTKNWDKVVGGLWRVAIYIALPLVASLDRRSGWTGEINLIWHVVGGVVLVAGLALSAWAMVANAFFSTAVRIQRERGHTVCSTGPCWHVRPPGYLGFILRSLSIPFLLASLWSLVPGIAAGALMIVRTHLEDRTLQNELPGYRSTLPASAIGSCRTSGEGCGVVPAVRAGQRERQRQARPSHAAAAGT